MERKKLLITGCERSDTLYAAAVWQSLGLDIRHERPVPPNEVMGADGMVGRHKTIRYEDIRKNLVLSIEIWI